MSKEIVEIFSEEIDLILERLDRTRSKKDIIRWLENFEEKDRKEAIEVLQRLQFVTQGDLFELTDDLIEKISSGISKKTKIYLYPIAKYGKSATHISYYITKSPVFARLERHKQTVFITNEFDIKNAKFDNNSIIVLFDDFFGSGDSFKKYYDYLISLSDPSFANVEVIYGACYYYMENAKVKIRAEIPNINLIGQLHERIFGISPIMFSNQNDTEIKKKMCFEYADSNGLFINSEGKHNLGYKDSEALLSFTYMPPNNTLPIIWSNKSKWVPLIPRNVEMIISLNQEYRKELLFSSSMKELGVKKDFSGDFGHEKERYIIFGMIRMINRSLPMQQIINYFGTNKLLTPYIELAQFKGFIDANYKLTALGIEQLNLILNEIKEYKARKNKDIVYNDVDYMPKKISKE